MARRIAAMSLVTPLAVSVTTIAVEGVDVEALRTLAREHFQVAVAGGLGPLTGRAFRIGHLGDSNPALILGAIAGGLGPMTGKAFRIGHLGDQNPAQILGALGGVEAALVMLGIPHGSGLRRAIETLAAGA